VISQRIGRLLSALGALLLIGGLFLTWYHIDRAGGFVESSTGFDTFPRLRVLILAGAIVLLLSAVVAQTRAVLVVRTLVGLALGVLILRRIAFPPDLADPISAQAGVLVGLVGAVAGVVGGLVDSSREAVERYPEMAFWRPPAGELGGGAGASHPMNGARHDAAGGHTVDSTAEEI
jgi:hypothetical protein